MTSHTATCLCGNIKISFKGDPASRAICHCLDCRKITGSDFSDNLFLPNDDFTLESGTPKTFTKKAASGYNATNHFCPDCGNTLYRTTESKPDKKILKTGMVDDPAFQSAAPANELWTKRKNAWLPAVGEAAS